MNFQSFLVACLYLYHHIQLPFLKKCGPKTMYGAWYGGINEF